MAPQQTLGNTLQYRTVFLSDIHLGYKDCKADYLLDFLEKVECETLYLLGDVVDLWALKRHIHWPAAHYRVLRALFNKALSGTRVIYIPGNHDEPLRDYVGHTLGPVEIQHEGVHETADGKRLLLFHGDAMDTYMRVSRINRWIGDGAYDFLLFLNRWVNFGRRRLGFPYWSLACWLKTRVKNAREAIETFEHAAVMEARRRGLDGVICGHIHKAEILIKEGLVYCNDGDWVESCTALVEDERGCLEILHWSERRHSLKVWAASNDEVLERQLELAV